MNARSKRVNSSVQWKSIDATWKARREGKIFAPATASSSPRDKGGDLEAVVARIADGQEAGSPAPAEFGAMSAAVRAGIRGPRPD